MSPWEEAPKFDEIPAVDYITRRQQLKLKDEKSEEKGKKGRGKGKAKAKRGKALQDDDDEHADEAGEPSSAVDAKPPASEPPAKRPRAAKSLAKKPVAVVPETVESKKDVEGDVQPDTTEVVDAGKPKRTRKAKVVPVESGGTADAPVPKKRARRAKAAVEPEVPAEASSEKPEPAVAVEAEEGEKGEKCEGEEGKEAVAEEVKPSAKRKAKAAAKCKAGAKAKAKAKGAGGRRAFVSAEDPELGSEVLAGDLLPDRDAFFDMVVKDVLECLETCKAAGTLDTKGKHDHEHACDTFELRDGLTWNTYWSRKAAGLKLENKQINYFSRETPCCGTNIVLLKHWVRISSICFVQLAVQLLGS